MDTALDPQAYCWMNTLEEWQLSTKYLGRQMGCLLWVDASVR